MVGPLRGRPLTASDPRVVEAAYRSAVKNVRREGHAASAFARSSAATQVGWLRDLGVATANAEAAVRVLGPPPAEVVVPLPDVAVVSSGHMLDLPGRASLRFPKQNVAAARA